MEARTDALIKKDSEPEPLQTNTAHTYEVGTESLKGSVDRIFGRVVETGRLPGAPVAHQKLANYVEYAQALVHSTTTVAEGITAQQLQDFAWGLPCLGGTRPRNSQIDMGDMDNLKALENCLPTLDAHVGSYHVSSTYHAAKLLLIAAANPRAIEWMFLAAILAQRGLYTNVMAMLRARKDKFLDAMKDRLGNHIDYPTTIAYSATLDRLIANVVTSLQALNMGELGAELAHEGHLPDSFDLEYYVTGDALMFTVAKEAQALGCQFHDEIVLVDSNTPQRKKGSKRAWPDVRDLTKQEELRREQRIDLLRASPGEGRYSTVNIGPTGRVPHARLVSGLVTSLLSRAVPEILRQNLETALAQSCDIGFSIEVHLKSGIGEILLDQAAPKGILHCPALHLNAALGNALSQPATIEPMDDLLTISPPYEMGLLTFPFSTTDGKMWNRLVLAYLVVKGWWWSKHLIRDLPERLFVPTHKAYFSTMALIGSTMLHLEQNTGCSITTNTLFDGLRFLTNLGGIHDYMTAEAMTYAAQGPGVYVWLQGKFMTVPEVALFAHGNEYRHPIRTPQYTPRFSDDPGTGSSNSFEGTLPAATIFADCTVGHTLSCAIVTQKRKIRVLPLSRVLCGTLLAYIGYNPACTHDRVDSASKLDFNILPWSVVQEDYFGNAEVEEEDAVLVTGTEGSRLGQAMALAVTKDCTAIDTKGCLECAFSRSSHVITTA
ncbi:hypothetical protein LTR10_007878 [Elasticomyces elasticus]|nr:hypothetical protein LTR10_007878 [Elasticomyces elasticus]KAK4970878.1 hypothetical protein LTR42_007855 [Elasticomyces elasticus]